MRQLPLVSVVLCACGAIAVDPSSSPARDEADAAADSGVGQAPDPVRPESRDCRPATDAVEPAGPVSLPPGVTADFAVRGVRPVIAVSPNGDAVVAWHDAGHVRVRLYRDSRWLDVETITSPDGRSRFSDLTPKVAMRADGTVVVAYNESPSHSHNVVCTRERDANGTWSMVSTLAVTGIGSWQEPSPPIFMLAADGAGNITALVDAEPTNGGLLAFRAPAGSGFGAASPLTTEAVRDFTFAVNASGEALVVWSEGGPVIGTAKAAAFSPAAGWGATEGPIDVGLASLSATAEHDGSMSVLGARYFEDGREQASVRVETATRSPDGRWSAPTDLADLSASYARIASDDLGRAMVAGGGWISECTVTSAVVRRDATGTWGAVESIPGAPPGRTTIGEIALSRSGHGLVAWQGRRLSNGSCVSDGMHLSWLSPEGAWSPPTLLDSETDSHPTLALTPSGRALVVWSHGDRVLARWVDPP